MDCVWHFKAVSTTEIQESDIKTHTKEYHAKSDWSSHNQKYFSLLGNFNLQPASQPNLNLSTKKERLPAPH